MFFRSMRGVEGLRQPDGYFACVAMPVRIGPELAERAFVRPLNRELAQTGLGRVSEFEVARDDEGEPVGLKMTLSLATDAPRALEHVAGVLERLDAPTGSWIGNAECPEMVAFGRSFGLGLYLPRGEADEEAKLDIVEACTDALEGAGLYQGSASVGDRTALYFYGDSFNRMRAAVTFVMSTDPRCRDAYARRLN